MGYRNYIGFLPKKEYNKIKSLNKVDLFKLKNVDIEDDYIGPYNIVKELYEFGKYCDFETDKLLKPFFKNKEFQKEYTEDMEFYVVEKLFLKKIIDSYNEKIKEYYNGMMSPFLGIKDSVYEKEEPSKFLSSIKKSYKSGDDDITYNFDFNTITPQESTALFKMIEHIRSFRTEWTCLTPYDLEKGDEITTSWKYEYGVFELVRIYKSFDWKKNVMVYYGY